MSSGMHYNKSQTTSAVTQAAGQTVLQCLSNLQREISASLELMEQEQDPIAKTTLDAGATLLVPVNLKLTVEEMCIILRIGDAGYGERPSVIELTEKGGTEAHRVGYVLGNLAFAGLVVRVGGIGPAEYIYRLTKFGHDVYDQLDAYVEPGHCRKV